MLDTLICQVIIPHSNEEMDVGVENGFITYLSRANNQRPQAKHIIEGNGHVLLPGLIEPHIHLDKAYLLDHMKQEASTLDEAIRLTGNLKKDFTKEDIQLRSIKVLEKCISYGVTSLRCHVEVDPIVDLIGVETLLQLREQYRDRIDLQLVTFPQEGIFKLKGTAELMEESLKMGVDVIGGIPYNDINSIEHLDFVFELAHKYDKPIDLHVDFSDDPNQLAIKDIISRTQTYQMEGRVSVGHLTSLGSVPYEDAKKIASDIAKADIHVMALPATDLFLNGRGDKEKVRRGVTPVRLLLEAGVNVTVGTNNIQNPFTPFGTGDPLDAALLLAHVAHMGTLKDAEILLEMTTVNAAGALGIPAHGIKLNHPADFVLFHSKNRRNVLLERPQRLGVWKKGKQVVDKIDSCVKA